MTVTIQVRRVPVDVHRRLKARAAEECMSLSEFLRRELARIARRPAPEEIRERLAGLARIRTPEPVEEMIRRDRDARRSRRCTLCDTIDSENGRRSRHEDAMRTDAPNQPVRSVRPRIAVAVVIAGVGALVAWLWPGSNPKEHPEAAPTQVPIVVQVEASRVSARAETPIPSAAPSDSRFRVRIRDVCGGEAVPGVRVIDGASGASAVCDERGAAEFPPDTAGRASSLAIEPASWSVAGVRTARPEDECDCELWVYRVFEIEGRAVLEGVEPGSRTMRRLTVRLNAIPPYEGGTAVRWTTKELRMTGNSVQPDAEGRFRIRSPLVDGLEVSAGLEGWSTCRRGIPSSAVGPDLRASVFLELPRAPRLRGRCTDSGGAPVAGARIAAYIVRRDPTARLELAELLARHPNGGVTGHAGADGSVVTVHRESKTDDDGRYEIPLPDSGELFVVPRAIGFRATARRAPDAASSDMEFDVVVEAGAAGRSPIRITVGGVPVPQTEFGVAELDSELPFQPGFVVKTDSEGRVGSEWFEAGRLYRITPIPRGSEASSTQLPTGKFRYEGGEALDLRDLIRGAEADSRPR